MQPRTSGIEPPVYFRVRTADEVEPKVDVPPTRATKPPSEFWNAAT
jgi:hypothetical protein